MHHFRINPERVFVSPTRRLRSRAPPDSASPCRVRGSNALGVRGRYLLYPAQFWAHKNHATLFESVAKLARDGRDPYELVLVGSDKGPARRTCTPWPATQGSQSSSTFSASSRPTIWWPSISTRTHSRI